MGVENIEKRILGSAKAEAEKIVREAEEEARARIESAKAENAKRAQAAAAATRGALQQRHGQQTTSARAANKLKLLARKSEILEDIFESAVERFIGDRDGEYANWLAARLDSVAGQTGSIVPAKDDRALIGKLLATHGGNSSTLAEESLPLRGGFVLKGDKIDIDLSLDAQLAELKEELLPELARKAFESLTTGKHG